MEFVYGGNAWRRFVAVSRVHDLFCDGTFCGRVIFPEAISVHEHPEYRAVYGIAVPFAKNAARRGGLST